MGEVQPKTTEQNQKRTNTSFYKTAWRWHFYAGILFAPFLILLTVTGSIYLFKPQIEQVLYKEYYEVTAQGEKMSPSEQIENVKELYPDAVITTYRPGEHAEHSSEVGISTSEGSFTMFIDPYTGKSLGDRSAEDKIMNKIEEIHGYDKDELRGPIVEGAPYATVWQDGTNLPTITNNFNNQFISAFLGERPLKEALKDAEEQANKEIQN